MSTPTLRVCSFESRRADEIAALIRRHGGVPTVAPSMQEVPLDDNQAVFDFVETLLAGRFDAVIFLTGVGARTMMEIAERRYDRQEVLIALAKASVIIRGPKPAVVMRDWNVPVTLAAPEPNTWREIIAAIDGSNLTLQGSRIAVQEYGQPSDELYTALQERGAIVTAVPVYSWTLPDDTAPLEAAIREAVKTGFDLYLFTSAQQVRHALQVADSLGQEQEWRTALVGAVVGSIGPTCSDALRKAGLPVDLEPSLPKMGTLVREACLGTPDLLRTKRPS